MSAPVETDYKSKCNEMSAQNISLTAEVASLNKVAEVLKDEVEKWKKEFDGTVASHNQIRDQAMTMLSELLSFISNSKFLDSAQIEQQKAQMAALQEQLKKQQQQPSQAKQ